MEFGEKEIKQLSIIVLIIILAVLVFLLVRPVLYSIIGGLILAYILSPIYRRILKKVKSPNLAASIITLIVLIIVIVPLWLIVPQIVTQIFSFLHTIQNIDIHSFIGKVFPTASESFTNDLASIFNNFISKVASYSLTQLTSWLINIPKIILQISIIFFVFYFSLRDSVKLKSFILGISPFSKAQEKVLVNKFKGVTDSILYGQIIIGIVQGVVAGIGLLIFGVPNALFLTLLSIFLGIIPVIGPVIIWVPVTLILLAQGNTFVAIGFLIYNILLTSGVVEHVLKPYVMARKTDLSTVTVLIGMIGGLFFFGLIGLFLGPLLLSYFLIVLRAYRDRSFGIFNGRAKFI